MINLKAAAAVAAKDLNNIRLGAVILGPPSAGKSGCLGTFGVKTLYAYFGAETHGLISSTMHGSGDLEPYPLSFDDTGKSLNADQTYKRLLDLLADKETLKAEGIQAIALDGLTELEQVIMETSAWKSRVETEKKGVTAYSGDVTLSMFRPVMDGLRSLQRDLDMHYAVTCILDVQKYDDTGIILDGSPKLKGYDVAVGLILQIPTRIMIGTVVNEDDFQVPRFQWTAKAHRSTSDQKTKAIRKTHSFRPQVIGCDMTTFPEHSKADLSRIIAFKKSKKFVKQE